MQLPAIGVAVSGGVDSLVAAFLLKQQYKQVFGLHFTTGYEAGKTDMNRLKDQLKMDVIPLDLSGPFENQVIQYFVSTYTQGKTPNPCMVCNQKIKFGALLEEAKKRGADYLATGHYATIVNGLTQPELNMPDARLEKAADEKKDQSYFLARLSCEQLSQILCPLAPMTKDQVKRLAARHHLTPVTAKESQDICFIHDPDFFLFVAKKTGIRPEPGPVVDIDGRQVGTHNGVHAFTVGQRRGINCPASEPYYVRKIDPAAHTLHVCFKKDLARKEMTVEQLVWHDAQTGGIQTGDAQPVDAQPDEAQPLETQPVEVQTDSDRSDRAGSDQAGSDRAGSDLAGSGLAGSGLAGSGQAGSDRAGSGLAGFGMAGSDRAGSGLAGSGAVGRDAVRPEDARPDTARSEPALAVAVKIRYRHTEAPATLIRRGTGGKVIFQQPQYAVAPGQAAVFYRGRQVLGSAIIQ
jgi:tRNA-uridine 2-sulfurtransferase